MSSSTGSTISSGGGAGPSDALSTPLAPGFRFHPTDEELVSYYLRRKVLGLPLKVNAIAEVDLYKCDPWDLPARSRIRSRDGEWYFFSPLDRKYANGSGKTNRATGKGYWKTTGKDRAVYRRGSGKAVGMKKTLVFHVGKAPKGERTNWVMHEYRIEGEYDEQLREAGVSQDSYVVCRIFQKAGPGPQNGAQYGAPLVDEDWREYDDFDVKIVLPVASIAAPTTPNANPAPAASVAAAATALVPCPADEDFNVLFQEQMAHSFSGSLESVLDVNDDKNGMDNVDSVAMDGDSQQVLDFPIETYSPSIGVDDYLELNDFMDPVDMYLSNDQALYTAPDTGCGNVQMSPNTFGQRYDLPATDGMENFPFTTEEEEQLMQAHPVSNRNLSFDMDDILDFDPSQYLLDGGADDEFLFPNEYIQMGAVGGSCSRDVDKSQYLVATGSSSADPLDDIAGFFETPEDEQGYTFPDSADSTAWLHNPRLASKGDVVALQMNSQPSDIGGSSWSPASKIEPPAISQANIEHFDVYARDSKTDDSSSKTTITKRLWSMLDSISAPPALAAEAPLIAKSLVFDPAAWMKANSLAFEGKEKAAGSKPSKDSASIFEPCFWMHHCATSWMARNGFSVCFSVLLLAASVKIGRCYSRLFFM